MIVKPSTEERRVVIFGPDYMVVGQPDFASIQAYKRREESFWTREQDFHGLP